MMKKISILLLTMVPAMLWAQFAPEAGVAGTTAMHADSSAFVAWATGCTIERGPQQIDDPSLGMVSYGVDDDALGKADNMVVSLGDGGTAVLTFASPIYNDAGPDFAVFENPFHNTPHCFLELAFVEVSSDGENYFPFPAVTNVPFDTQMGGFGVMDATMIHNFAGKYEVMYGTPFDLDEVEDDARLDKGRITHIRLIDVIGTIDPEYATYDSEGHIVNDPFPTPFWSSGFDLDAVGVIHDLAHFDVPEYQSEVVTLYPNPVKDRLTVKAENLQSVEVYNLVGQQVVTSSASVIDFSDLNEGVYFVRVTADGKTITKRVVKQ
jgi:hypothetical protein